MRENIEKNYVTTTSVTVSQLIDWLRNELNDCEYGKVGLVFSVHDRCITRAEQIKETKYLIQEENEELRWRTK